MVRAGGKPAVWTTAQEPFRNTARQSASGCRFGQATMGVERLKGQSLSIVEGSRGGVGGGSKWYYGEEN